MISEITVAQMQEVERIAETEFGLSPAQLMENAGRTISTFVLEEIKPAGLVSILVGKGHNGGDGLVAARYLHEANIPVEIILVEPNGLRELTHSQLKMTREAGIAEADFPDEDTSLVIDCMLGYGAKGCPDERISDLNVVANALDVPKLSVDIPTGFEVETNTWHAPFFARSALLTLGLPKSNLLNNPHIKEVYAGEIGLPPELYKKMKIEFPPHFGLKPYVKITD